MNNSRAAPSSCFGSSAARKALRNIQYTMCDRQFHVGLTCQQQLAAHMNVGSAVMWVQQQGGISHRALVISSQP